MWLIHKVELRNGQKLIGISGIFKLTVGEALSCIHIGIQGFTWSKNFLLKAQWTRHIFQLNMAQKGTSGSTQLHYCSKVCFLAHFGYVDTRQKQTTCCPRPKKSPQQSFYHFLIISFYQATLWLVLGDKQGVRMKTQAIVMLRIRGEEGKLLFCYHTREQNGKSIFKMNLGARYVSITRRWQGVAWQSATCSVFQELVFFWIFANIFTAKVFFFSLFGTLLKQRLSTFFL